MLYNNNANKNTPTMEYAPSSSLAVFNQSEILFSDVPYSAEMPHQKPGILRLIMRPELDSSKNMQPSVSSQKIAIIITIDASVLMTDYSIDNRRKIEQAIYTLKGMMTYLAEHEATCGGRREVCVAILSSQPDMSGVCPRTIWSGFPGDDGARSCPISYENLPDIITKIDEEIKVDAMQDMAATMKEATRILDEYGRQNPEARLYHIQLIDGEYPAAAAAAAEYISPDVSKGSEMRIHITFGKYLDLTHHQKLLEYHRRHTDKIENAKLVYSEILYNILYHLYDKLEINLGENTGVEIYNSRTNEWGSRLLVTNVPYNCDRIFHLRADSNIDPIFASEAVVRVVDDNIDAADSSLIYETIYCYPKLIDFLPNEDDTLDEDASNLDENSDLLQYGILCQKTEELLYKMLDPSGGGGGADAPPGASTYEECRKFFRNISSAAAAEAAYRRLATTNSFLILKSLYRKNAHAHAHAHLWCDSAGDCSATSDIIISDAPLHIQNSQNANIIECKQRSNLYYTTKDPPIYTFELFDHPMTSELESSTPL